jgi:hypothetical protein
VNFLVDVLGYNYINSENVDIPILSGIQRMVVDQSAEQLVFVYISLLQGELTSVIDSYVWNVTSRDEEHSLVCCLGRCKQARRNFLLLNKSVM